VLHLHTWDDHGNPQLFLLHSWMDVSASFQFRLDVLQEIWQFIAPDWRRLVRTSGRRILSSFDFARV
jgi:pimeloyl-ACP methyl ester carboxylesterase